MQQAATLRAAIANPDITTWFLLQQKSKPGSRNSGVPFADAHAAPHPGHGRRAIPRPAELRYRKRPALRSLRFKMKKQTLVAALASEWSECTVGRVQSASANTPPVTHRHVVAIGAAGAEALVCPWSSIDMLPGRVGVRPASQPASANAHISAAKGIPNRFRMNHQLSAPSAPRRKGSCAQTARRRN